ncbi:MAG: 2-oxoglutarate dehydrogenase E1 component [Vicinamibacterales bacterium]
MGAEAFQGVNAAYAQELYERYLANPDSVDADTRRIFATWTPDSGAGQSTAIAESPGQLRAAVGAGKLAESLRRYGHLAARLDPLGNPPPGDPALSPERHGITEADLHQLPASLIGGPAAENAANAAEVVARLRKTYCGSTGFDCSHVFVPEERVWLREAAESGRFRPPVSPVDADALLDRLTQVEVFERFLHRTFPGKTRFSVEGLDMLVPVLDEIIAGAADRGLTHALIGMAHRGRLNVLAHVLQKPYSQILAEFKDPVDWRTWRIDLGFSGDVKYHAGATVQVHGKSRGHITVSMAPNPSHLEAVNPVVEGMARAAGTQVHRPGRPHFESDVTLPLLIHGDAAFPGQGVVAETLNLSRLHGYRTGGTIHIIANNQLGFTATPAESYSTSYASGLARGFKIPIIHVNADDPIACIEAARLAWAYRSTFGKDCLIDLVGYRRHGHNEGDEPAFTQPALYQRVSLHPTVRDLLARSLKAQGHAFAADPEALVQKHFTVLEQALTALKPEVDFVVPMAPAPPVGAAARAETAVPLNTLHETNEGLLTRPRGFTIHKKLERTREKRWQAFDDPAQKTIDWATAEELALATILADGTAIRFTGEDVGRGTFSHRHAVLHDAVSGEAFIPLQSFPQARASFEIRNSPLSELAAIGFEFGYNVQAPDRLVIWEAQYGDFINGAQIILDTFVTSARAKWGLTPSLVLLLPHAYEGQGPEHSSARVERFLQSAADTNMRIANCTTAAQYFHLLRRQAATLTVDPLPLIVLTPKSLLRHPAVASSPAELAGGRFQPVIDDTIADAARSKVTRAVLCNGKVAVDVMTSEARPKATHVAVIRVEQLYPFPAAQVREALGRYPKLKEVVWLQEEPENMGAWEFMRPLLGELLDGRRLALRYVGRTRAASPSEGSSAWHQLTQKALIEQVLDTADEAVGAPLVLSKRV